MGIPRKRRGEAECGLSTPTQLQQTGVRPVLCATNARIASPTISQNDGSEQMQDLKNVAYTDGGFNICISI
jgi:hypothetical protein